MSRSGVHGMHIHHHYLENCGFMNEAWLPLGPTHNTSISTAKAILGSKKFLAGDNNFGFVSLRYGIGAMYFGGVVFEFDLERMLDHATPLDIEIIDKAGKLEELLKDAAFKSKSIGWKLRFLSQEVQRLITFHETSGEVLGLTAHPDFDNFPELRVKGDLSTDFISRIYVPTVYRQKWDDAAITVPPSVKVDFVNIGATEEDLYLLKLEDDEFKGQNSLKSYEKLVAQLADLKKQPVPKNPIKASEHTQERLRLEELTKTIDARRKQLAPLVQQAEDEGLFLRKEKYTWDYHILGTQAHSRLSKRYVENHILRASEVLGQAFEVANYYDAGNSQLNAYLFKNKKESPTNSTLVVEMGGTGGQLTLDDRVLRAPDPDELLSAHSYALYGISSLIIPRANHSDVYFQILNALKDVIRKFKVVALHGFCGSCIAAANFANENPLIVHKLILSAAPPSTPDPKSHLGKERLLLIGWNDQAAHHMKRFDELQKLVGGASYAKIYSGTQQQKKIYGRDYYFFGGPVADDIRRFIHGIPIARNDFDPLARKRNEPTVTLSEKPLPVPVPRLPAPQVIAPAKKPVPKPAPKPAPKPPARRLDERNQALKLKGAYDGLVKRLKAEGNGQVKQELLMKFLQTHSDGLTKEQEQALRKLASA